MFFWDAGLIPLQATLEIVKVVEPIEVTEFETILGLYRPHGTIDLRLTLKNPTPEGILIDMEDTPLDVLLMDGTLPEDYFSHTSDIVWYSKVPRMLDTQFSLVLPLNFVKIYYSSFEV